MNFDMLTENEIFSIASPIMDNLMEASTRVDHVAHVRDFSDRLKAIVTERYLQRVCEQYQSEKGFFTERQPVAVFKSPDSAVIVWRQGFSQAEGDYVAEMVLVHQNGKYLCDHVMVF